MAEEKQHVSIVVAGHVDAGKSSLTGRLLYDMGGIDERMMEKLKKKAEELGKPGVDGQHLSAVAPINVQFGWTFGLRHLAAKSVCGGGLPGPPAGTPRGVVRFASRGRGCLLTCGDVHPNPGPKPMEGSPSSLLQVSNRPAPQRDLDCHTKALSNSNTRPGPGYKHRHESKRHVLRAVGSVNTEGSWRSENDVEEFSENIPPKIYAALGEMRRYSLDILFVNETRLRRYFNGANVSIKASSSFPSLDCKLFHTAAYYPNGEASMPGGIRGGVGVLIRSDLLLRGKVDRYVTNVQPLDDFGWRLRYHWGRKQFVHLSGLYIPPSLPALREVALERVAASSSADTPDVVMGDLNCHINIHHHGNSAPTNSAGQALEDWAQLHDYQNILRCSRQRHHRGKRPAPDSSGRWRRHRQAKHRTVHGSLTLKPRGWRNRGSIVDHVYANSHARKLNCRMKVRSTKELSTDHRIVIATFRVVHHTIAHKAGMTADEAFAPRTFKECSELDKEWKEIESDLKDLQKKEKQKKMEPYISDNTMKLLEEHHTARRVQHRMEIKLAKQQNDATAEQLDHLRHVVEIREKAQRQVRRSIRQDRDNMLQALSAKTQAAFHRNRPHEAFGAIAPLYKKRATAFNPTDQQLDEARQHYMNLFRTTDNEYQEPKHHDNAFNLVDDFTPEQQHQADKYFQRYTADLATPTDDRHSAGTDGGFNTQISTQGSGVVCTDQRMQDRLQSAFEAVDAEPFTLTGDLQGVMDRIHQRASNEEAASRSSTTTENGSSDPPVVDTPHNDAPPRPSTLNELAVPSNLGGILSPMNLQPINESEQQQHRRKGWYTSADGTQQPDGLIDKVRHDATSTAATAGSDNESTLPPPLRGLENDNDNSFCTSAGVPRSGTCTTNFFDNRNDDEGTSLENNDETSSNEVDLPSAAVSEAGARPSEPQNDDGFLGSSNSSSTNNNEETDSTDSTTSDTRERCMTLYDIRGQQLPQRWTTQHPQTNSTSNYDYDNRQPDDQLGAMPGLGSSPVSILGPHLLRTDMSDLRTEPSEGRARIPFINSPADVKFKIGVGFKGRQASAQFGEVLAIAIAVWLAPDNTTLDIYTDSLYCFNMGRNLARCWTAVDMAHAALWRFIAHRATLVCLRFHKVKSHSGVIINEFADEMATRAINVGEKPGVTEYIINQVSREVDAGRALRPNDDEPTEEQIEQAIRRLKRYKCGGKDGIRPETLKSILPKAVDGIRVVPELFTRFCCLIQRCWRESATPLEWLDGLMVLLPKFNGATKLDDMRGITLLSCCLKVLCSIQAERLTYLQIDRSQHGFVPKTGCMHAVLASNLRIQALLRENRFLYVAFIDIKKAYDSVLKPLVSAALRLHGSGPKLAGLHDFIAYNNRVSVSIAGCYTEAFTPLTGLLQGENSSPPKFNLIIDCIITEFYIHRPSSSSCIFYADDGQLAATSAEELQKDLDVLTGICAHYSLVLSVKKTKVMIFKPPRMHAHNSGKTGSYKEKLKEIVACNVCGKEMRRDSINRHQKTAECIKAQKRSGVKPEKALDRGLEEQMEALGILDVRQSPETEEQKRRRLLALEKFPYLRESTTTATRHLLNEDEINNYDPPACWPTYVSHEELVPDKGKQKTPFYCYYCTDQKKPQVDQSKFAYHLRTIHGVSLVREPTGQRKNNKWIPCPRCGIAILTNPKTLNGLINHLKRSTNGCKTFVRKADTREVVQQYHQEASADHQFSMVAEDGERHLIEVVDEFKYLGFQTSRRGTSDAAFKYSVSAAYQQYGRFRRLYRVSGSRMSVANKRAIANVVVLARLLYGCENWALTKKQEHRLIAVHSKILRSVTQMMPKKVGGAMRYPSYAALLKAAKTEHIVNTYRRRRLTFACKVMERPVECSIAREQLNKLLGSSNGEMRHNTSWLAHVEQDARKAQINLHKLERRSLWAKAVADTDFVTTE